MCSLTKDLSPTILNIGPIDETFYGSEKQDSLKKILYIRYKRLANVLQSSGLTLS